MAGRLKVLCPTCGDAVTAGAACPTCGEPEPPLAQPEARTDLDETLLTRVGAALEAQAKLAQVTAVRRSGRVVERHVDAFNARDTDAEPWSDDGALVAPNASMHGREQVLGFLGVFWEAFPDGRLETSRIIGEESVAAAEGRFTGTHTGVLRTPAGDVEATGRHVDLRWMSSYEVRGDELSSEHLYFDQADMLGQLGLMPAP